jgi:hypothetical protein
MASGFKAVAHLRFSDEAPGSRVIVLQLAPDTSHENAKVLGICLVLWAPHVVEELALGHLPTWIADQDLGDVRFLRGEVDLDPVRQHPLDVDGGPLGSDPGVLLYAGRASPGSPDAARSSSVPKGLVT